MKSHIDREKNFCIQLQANPYLQSRALWNDVYGNLEKKLHISQLLNFFMGLLLLIAIIGLIILSQRVTIKPYPFIIHGNEVITVSETAKTQVDAIKPELAIFLAKNYINYVRSLSSDPNVNIKNQMSAYAMSRQQALSIIKNYYKDYSHNQIANKKINQITITSVLQRSTNSIHIRWQEQWYNIASGELLERKNYLAEIVFDFDKPSKDPLVLQNNPLGFYVKQLSWSDENTPQEG